MCKVERNLRLPEAAASMFNKPDQDSLHQTRAVTNGNYTIKRSKTVKGKLAITHAGPVIWNSLPTELRKGSIIRKVSRKTRKAA